MMADEPHDDLDPDEHVIVGFDQEANEPIRQVLGCRYTSRWFSLPVKWSRMYDTPAPSSAPDTA